MLEIGPEFLISVQTGYFSGFPEPWSQLFATSLAIFRHTLYSKMDLLKFWNKYGKEFGCPDIKGYYGLISSDMFEAARLEGMGITK